jgi:hypothetical protein
MEGFTEEYIDIRMKILIMFTRGHQLPEIAKILGIDYSKCIHLSNHALDIIKWYGKTIKEIDIERTVVDNSGFKSWRMDDPTKWYDVDHTELSDDEQKIYLKRLSLH